MRGGPVCETLEHIVGVGCEENVAQDPFESAAYLGCPIRKEGIQKSHERPDAIQAKRICGNAGDENDCAANERIGVGSPHAEDRVDLVEVLRQQAACGVRGRIAGVAIPVCRKTLEEGQRIFGMGRPGEERGGEPSALG